MNSLSAQANALRVALKDSAASGSLDAQTQAALVALQETLGEYLLQQAASSQDESVVDHLEAIAVRFENEHPAVGTAIREAINVLAKAGI